MGVLEESIVSMTKEYLAVAKVFDKKLVDMGEKHQAMSAYKKSNPGVKFEDIKKELTELFVGHQTSALLIKDVETLISRLTVLQTLIQLGNIEMELDEDSEFILNNVSKALKLYYTIKDGELEPLQKDVVEAFNSRTTEKLLNEDTLKNLFDNL